MNPQPIVVHVGNYDPDALDGVSATVVGQCDGLATMGVPLEIWMFHPGILEICETQTASGVPIFTLPRFKNRFLAAMAVPGSTKKWINARLSQIRLFHLHSVFSPHNNYVGSLGLPYVITPNGGWSDSVIHGRRKVLKTIWISLFESKLWKNARFVQAVSVLEATQLGRLIGIAKVIHLPNGVRSIKESQYPPFEKRDIWLFLGRLALEQKGLDMLIDAYAQFATATNEAPKLILAGPDFRGDLSLLQEQVERLGIVDKIEFTGPLRGSDKERIWERTALFLHPSRWEGMPLAILEALGHGIPCLVSPETGLGEWIEKNEAGWMVEADIETLSQAFTNIQKNRQHLKTRGANALNSVQRDFSWDRITKRLYAEYTGHANGTVSSAQLPK